MKEHFKQSDLLHQGKRTHPIHHLTLKNKKIFKKNDLINANYSLSLMEQKLIAIFACMVSSANTPLNTVYEITARDFCRLVGLTRTNNYANHIRKVIKKLMDRESFTIGKTDYNWVASATYHKTGVISFEFPEKLLPYLQSAAKGLYTQYYVSNILPLEHQYSPRIYELCKQYRAFEQRIHSIEEWKDLLGIPPDKYKRTYNFIEKVIKPAEKEIYKLTDLGVKHFIAGKNGKTITHIGFHIHKGKKRPKKKEALGKVITETLSWRNQAKDTNLYSRKLDEYNREVDNFPHDNQPHFREYLEMQGMKVIKSPVKGLRYDIAFINGIQSSLNLEAGKKRVRISTEPN